MLAPGVPKTAKYHRQNIVDQTTSRFPMSFIGPEVPSHLKASDPTTNFHNADEDDDDDSDDDFGPKPLPAGMQHQQTDAVKEFIEREEKRRKLAEVCNNTTFIQFYIFFIPTLNRMLLNPRVLNETNGCLSHHHHQVFSEVSILTSFFLLVF